MSNDQEERIPRSAQSKDTLPSQTKYVPGQRSQRNPVCVDVVDVGRLATVPASQRVVVPSGPASSPPVSEETSVRINVRPDSVAPSTRRSPTSSAQLAQTPAGKVLAPFRRDWTGLKAPTERDPEYGHLRRYVSEVVGAIGMDAISVYVLQMKPFKDLYRDMPISMREAARGGFTTGLDAGLVKTVTDRLTDITRRGADATGLEDMPEYGEFQRVIDLIDDTSGGLLPQRIMQVARDTLLMAISARAFENEAIQNLLKPYVRLLEDGHLAVGLTKERRFLVITL